MPNKMQYYYKDNMCKADNALAANCICWHDESAGPLPDIRHTDEDQMRKIWRTREEADGNLP